MNHSTVFATIGFEDHQITCIIGVNPQERVEEQEIYVDLKVESNIFHAAATDSIHHTINYVTLAQLSTELAQARQYQLLETYAYELTEKVLADFDVNWVWVRIKKPQAIPSAAHTFVELKRGKSQ